MPSAITHQLVAEETKELLSDGLQHIIERAPDEYYLGCQGPDFLFFYRIGCKSEYNFGKYLHRNRPYEVFSLFARILSGDKSAKLPHFSEDERTRVYSYVLGYLTHNCTDATFHPYVYRYMEEENSPKREHQLMENDWDVYFLRELREQSAEKFQFGFKPNVIAESNALPKLFAAIAEECDREEVKPRKLHAGVKNFYRYLKFFHGKCYRRQKFWAGAERIFRAKPFFSALYPRESVDPSYLEREDFEVLSEGKGANADALFERAKQESVKLCELFCECVRNGSPLPKSEFSNGFLTGKPEYVD